MLGLLMAAQAGRPASIGTVKASSASTAR